MSLRLSALETGVTETFIIAAFVSSAALKDEDRLLSEINRMFARLFFIKGFFLRKAMTMTIQSTNLMGGALYMLVLHRQLNNFLSSPIRKTQ